MTADRRSALMSRIRGKDTQPELVVRRLAHALGYRFRLHRRDLPGTPDLTFPARRKVVFVHGCFWHQHRRCKYAYLPKANASFWQRKFAVNVRRDAIATRQLRKRGWHPLVLWECQLSDLKQVSGRLTAHLKSLVPDSQ